MDIILCLLFLTLLLFPGFTPSTNLGKAQADMIVDGCSDFAEKIVRPRFEKDEVKKVNCDLWRLLVKIVIH